MTIESRPTLGQKPERSICRGPTCKAEILWVRTAAGKLTCLNLDGSTHWGSCVDAALFKRSKSKNKKS